VPHRRLPLLLALLAVGLTAVVVAALLAGRGSPGEPASASPQASSGASATTGTVDGGPTVSPSPVVTLAPTEAVVSGQTPFGACPRDGDGTVFVNAEVEPWVTVNPTDPLNLVAVWQQDRWSNGAARGLMTGTSLDGGQTWERVAVPFTHCSEGNEDDAESLRASDPWAVFTADGIVLQVALTVNDDRSISAIEASRSTDGGLTWSEPLTVHRSGPDEGFNDKEAITAHPTEPGRAYIVWDRHRAQGEAGSASPSPQPSPQPSPAQIMFARTIDGGESWDAARPIADTPGIPIGNQIAVLPDGSLVNVYLLVPSETDDPRGTIEVIRSTDDGATWSEPTVLATARREELVVGEERVVRSGSALPDIAVDAGSGRMAVVWAEPAERGRGRDIHLAISSDGGTTWSDPAVVERDSDAAAFTPMVEYDAAGTLGVSYYDLRNDDPGDDAVATDRFLATSDDDGETWREQRLTDESFELLTAPDAGGLFLGDYVGLAAAGETWISAHTVTTGTTSHRTELVVEVIERDRP
jgi:hypothetical protein